MIIDSHCHAWPRWPYQPPVPDDEQRGRVEQLLHEMDQHGVDQAVVICARIDRNSDNNEYVAEQAQRHATRLHPFPDVDSAWSSTYHRPGASERLKRAIEKFSPKGFTHYLRTEDDGSWLTSEQGLQFFKVAAEHGLIASIPCPPRLQPAIRQIAEQFPSLPILCHHLGGIHASKRPPYSDLNEVLASAKLPNIYIKVSGFAYRSQVEWDYPYSDTLWIVRTLYEHFGPYRLCWGSDYPVVRFYMTYHQSIEAFRTHCTFVPEVDKSWILGDTLSTLLNN